VDFHLGPPISKSIYRSALANQILHFCPATPSKLQILFTRAPVIFQISPGTFPNSYFSPQNFFRPYLSIYNSESGGSCAKIFKMTSSFSSSYSYSYDCWICVIVCLSVRGIHFEADERRLQDQVYEDFKINYKRTPIFSFQSNEASALEYFVPIFLYLFCRTRIA
jgi:hypothetical protein